MISQGDARRRTLTLFEKSRGSMVLSGTISSSFSSGFLLSTSLPCLPHTRLLSLLLHLLLKNESGPVSAFAILISLHVPSHLEGSVRDVEGITEVLGEGSFSVGCCWMGWNEGNKEKFSRRRLYLLDNSWRHHAQSWPCWTATYLAQDISPAALSSCFRRVLDYVL